MSGRVCLRCHFEFAAEPEYTPAAILGFLFAIGLAIGGFALAANGAIAVGLLFGFIGIGFGVFIFFWGKARSPQCTACGSHDTIPEELPRAAKIIAENISLSRSSRASAVDRQSVVRNGPPEQNPSPVPSRRQPPSVPAPREGDPPPFNLNALPEAEIAKQVEEEDRARFSRRS